MRGGTTSGNLIVMARGLAIAATVVLCALAGCGGTVVTDDSAGGSSGSGSSAGKGGSSSGSGGSKSSTGGTGTGTGGSTNGAGGSGGSAFDDCVATCDTIANYPCPAGGSERPECLKNCAA